MIESVRDALGVFVVYKVEHDIIGPLWHQRSYCCVKQYIGASSFDNVL